MSDLENILTAVIAKKFEDCKVPANSQTSFKGKVEFEVDAVISKKDNIPVAAKVDIPYSDMIGVLLNRLVVLDSKIEPVSYLKSLMVSKCPEEYKNYLDVAVKEYTEFQREKLPKSSRASTTSVDGIVRLSKIVPKNR